MCIVHPNISYIVHISTLLSIHNVVPWTPVNRTEIGQHNLNTATTLNFIIPSLIPNTAQAVLLYVTAHCGFSTIDMGADISYYVVVNGTRYEHFLHMFGYRQQAHNTNSDNMWFPMPPNRLLYVGIPQEFPRNCHTYVSVIGHR